MIKKLLIGGGVVVLLSVFVLGWDKAVSYVDGAREHANKELDDKVPMDFEASRVQALIRKENQKILAYEDRVYDLESRRDGSASKIDDAKKQLARETATLQRIKALLDQKQPKYVIGGKNYSLAEVGHDALQRLKDVKSLQETISFHESLVTDLDTAAKQGRGNLAECRKRLVARTSEMERLKARNLNADVRMEISRLANSLADAPLAGSSELEKAFQNYDRRVRAKERRAASRLNAGKANYRIDYDAAFVTEDASAEIGKFLAGPANMSQAPAAAPVEKPSAVEALEDAGQD